MFQRLILISTCALLVACSAPDPIAPRLPAHPNLSTLFRADQVPVIQSAAVVESLAGDYVDWNLVRITFEDHALGEIVTVAGYSDSTGRWMFVTMSAASPYGAADDTTGTRSVDFYAPKTAAFVQLASYWAPDPADPNQARPTTGNSARVAIDPLVTTLVKRRGKK